jgi:SagB-type dehydrogenase family enzyme
MNKRLKTFFFLTIILWSGIMTVLNLTELPLLAEEKSLSPGESMKLPDPKFKSTLSVEESLLNRRSVREFGEDSLSIEQVSQLLWSAQGITSKWGGRTSPSAGALYPLEIYVLVGKVKGIKTGFYHYKPDKHSLTLKNDKDLREKLTKASLDQGEILVAPVTLVMAAVYEKTTKKYQQRGMRYVHMEVGSAGENIYLQCESLGLGTVFIGAFEDEEVKEVLGISEEPLGIMPVGKK